MNEFQLYFKLGLEHILSLSSWDHILFLFALIIVFELKEFKKIFLLTALFSIAHTTSLFLSAFNYVQVNEQLIENLIVFTIIITAFSNIVIKKQNILHKVHYYFSLFFGLIHGLGFAKDFKLLIAGQDKIIFPLFEFTLGIETAQIIVAFSFLIFSFMLISFGNLKKSIFIQILSILIIVYSFIQLI